MTAHTVARYGRVEALRANVASSASPVLEALAALVAAEERSQFVDNADHVAALNAEFRDSVRTLLRHLHELTGDRLNEDLLVEVEAL